MSWLCEWAYFNYHLGILSYPRKWVWEVLTTPTMRMGYTSIIATMRIGYTLIPMRVLTTLAKRIGVYSHTQTNAYGSLEGSLEVQKDFGLFSHTNANWYVRSWLTVNNKIITVIIINKKFVTCTFIDNVVSYNRLLFQLPSSWWEITILKQSLTG